MVFSSSIQKENTMSITRTKNGTYRLRVYIPEEVKSSLGIDKKVIEKRFKTRIEAKRYELELQNKFDKIPSGGSASLENSGSILFSDLTKQVKLLLLQNHHHKQQLTEQKLLLENTSYLYLVIIR